MDNTIYLNSLIDEKTKNKVVKDILDKDLYFIIANTKTKTFWFERVCSLLGVCNTKYNILIKNVKRITGYKYLYDSIKEVA